jgi:mono/diheme cytochrome c family protein/glucose/arabinose dehydrogenase
VSMKIAKLVVIAMAAVSSVAVGRALQSPAWPPGVQTVSSESPARSPEDELKTFFLPPGYRAELVASEPMIDHPVAFDWDADGRMWVIEMVGYMEDMAASTEWEPTSRVSILEDLDGDGRMDKKTVFADGLVLPRSIKVLADGALVAEPAKVWRMRDTNGDLKADVKELLCDNCYGGARAEVEHNQNGLFWAMDNWMHTSEGTTYFRLKGGALEVRRTLSRGQWGQTQDDFGRIYRNTNSSALSVDFVPTPYYARNPNLVRTRGSYEFAGEPAELNRTFPARSNYGVNRGYQAQQLRASDGTLATYTGVCAPTVYRGDRLPAELQGNIFLAEPTGNLVSRVLVRDDGRRLQATKAYENAEFLASTDERFRPVWLSSAPDGTLYIADLYHGMIQHRVYITEYLKEQILGRRLDSPVHKGRIWRIVHESMSPGPKPALSRETSAALVGRLSHPNGWWRDTAQQILVQRADVSVAGALTALVNTAPDVRTRIHALWTLDGLDRIDVATVTRALDHPSRDLRVAAIRVAERWLAEPRHPIQAAVLRKIDDPDWAVRQQLAASLGALPEADRVPAVATLLERRGEDPVVMDAALSGLRGLEPMVLDRLLQANAAQTPARQIAIGMLVATIMRGAQDESVGDVLTKIADEARPAWQREALLVGAESALLGAPLPGVTTGRGRGGAAPGAGRAGGGQTAAGPGRGAAPAGGRANAADLEQTLGRRAIPPPAEQTAAAAATARGAGAGGGRGRGGGRGGPALRLSHEPSLVAFSSGTGDLNKRAAAVLGRIEWPGKPGATVVTPLTPAEQQRFTAGREIYRNLCIGCHQVDGRGLDNVAASLLGSDLALAPAPVTARILINGKEGRTGLMPPLGAALNDDQIAAVLTYVRREWGQIGSPVDAAAVRTARAASAGRTRPWTNDELLAMVGPQ